jgi:hypothetical protein
MCLILKIERQLFTEICPANSNVNICVCKTLSYRKRQVLLLKKKPTHEPIQQVHIALFTAYNAVLKHTGYNTHNDMQF